MAAPKHRVGRLQRQVLRCFMTCGTVVKTSDLHEWCWPENRLRGQPITRWQTLSQARAAKSVGAVPVSREYREWVWQLGKPNS
jgi:hypothetical protein